MLTECLVKFLLQCIGALTKINDAIVNRLFFFAGSC